MERFLAVAMAFVMVLSLAACGSTPAQSTASSTAAPVASTAQAPAETPAAPAESTDGPLTFGVLIYKYDDTYISTVRNAITKYAGESATSITLDMQDGQGDQAKQNDQLDVLIQKKVDVLVVNMVDIGAAQGVADKAKAACIPVVFFNREPDKAVIDSAGSIFIGTTAKDAGVMQGDILADMWAANPEYDLNGDGTCQFLVFKGEPGNPEAEARTSFSISQAEARGMTMDNINKEPVVANWDTAEAQSKMEAILAANEGKIEAIFCNNDGMAIGVIAALNNAGYNTSKDSDKWIPVIGVDATDAAKEAISQGKMAATVLQDGDAMGAEVIAISTNAAEGKDFLDGTSYAMAEDGYSVRIPYAPVA